MIGSRWTPVLLLFLLSGCVRREGRNSDCVWVSAPAGGPRDLRADLEFAEELAIRYMEAHAGPRDLAAAARAKNHCMGILLAEIGKEHGMSAQEAFRSFGQRDAFADVVMNLPFVVLYGLASAIVVRGLLQRYPPGDGAMVTIAMMVLAAGVCGIAGVLVGQQWSAAAESIRVGTSHLSNRVFRLPIHQHPVAGFISLVAVFVSVAFGRYRIQKPADIREKLE